MGGLIRAKLPTVIRCSNRLPMIKNKNTGNSTTPKPYASQGSNIAKGGVLSKKSTAYIENMVGKQTKRKKKKEQKKTENDIVKRLAKNGLIDKDKASGIVKKKSSKKKKKKKKGSSSFSSYDSSSHSSIPRATLVVPHATIRRRSPRRRQRNPPLTISPLPQLRANREKRRKFRNSRTVWMNPTRT